MRELLFDVLLVILGVLGSRVIYSSLYKPSAAAARNISYVVGAVIAAGFYLTWATTGLDPIQLSICTVFSEAPVCIEKRALRSSAPPAPAATASPFLPVATSIPEPQRTVAYSPPAYSPPAYPPQQQLDQPSNSPCVQIGTNLVCPEAAVVSPTGASNKRQRTSPCAEIGGNLVCPDVPDGSSSTLAPSYSPTSCVEIGDNVVCPER